MRLHFLLVLICLSWPGANAQSKRTNIGIFGNGVGLDFNHTPPALVKIPEFSREEAGFDNFEGCATISDFNGNILFYSDGIHVWNRNNKVMSNGYFLNGSFHDDNTSNTTQCIIVPIPKDPFRYYLVTARMQGGALNYSLIDMRLDGGLGEVVQKAQPIFSPSAEKMCVVKHATRPALWLIGHEMGTNNFRTYLITEDGIDPTPVISAAGLVHIIDFRGSNSIGYLKPSHDGKFLGCAVAGDMGTFEYFNFDSSTGVVSGGTLLVDHNPGLPYGVEFSPDNTKLYVSHLLSGDFFQFDLMAPDVAASKITLATGFAGGVQAALQLGPDGKIYVDGRRRPLAYADSLDIIHSPNELGLSCNWQKNAIYLGRKVAFSGLPEFVSDVIDPLILHDKFCNDQEIQFNLANLSGFKTIDWDFGDPLSGDANRSSSLMPTHFYKLPGIYRLKVVATYENGIQVPYEQNVSILGKPVLEIGRDTVLCPRQSITLKPKTDNSVNRYLWYDSSSDVTKTVSAQGVYKVTVFNDACSNSDSLRVSFLQPQAFALKDTTICFDEELRIELPDGFDYTWKDGYVGKTRLIDQPNQYFIEARNRCENRTAKFTVKPVPRLALKLPNDTTLCSGETLELNATSEGAMYRWQDGSIDTTFVVTESGTYSVDISNRCETLGDTITVTYDGDIDYFIPNIISPNADVHNETFIVDSRFDEPDLSIFNRLGKKVFNERPYSNNWSGDGESGLYYFSLRYRCGLKKGWLHVLK